MAEPFMSDPGGAGRRGSRRPAAVVGLAVGVMVAAWLLGAPRSSGPDEPGHNVRAAALVRGQLDGEPISGVFQRGYELPAHIGFPDPVCYAFQKFVSAACATVAEPPTGTALLVTRAADYPIWGHLPAGVGTLGPASLAPWTARLFDALIPMLLLSAALLLAARRGALGVGATFAATTPMAWFMYGVVNPSGLVIAGGLGLWVGLEAMGSPSVSSRNVRIARWLTAASWGALVLPRRDGLVWASLILGLAVLLFEMDVAALWKRMGAGPAATIVGSTVATLAWAATSDTNDAIALFATPLVPVAVVAGRMLWRRLDGSLAARSVFVLAAAVGGAVGMLAIMNLRDNGFDRLVLRLVVGNTGDNLRQAIGVLGWLDTPIPTVAIYVQLLALGALVGVAVLIGDRTVVLGMGAIVAVAVLSSWTLTMLQNNDAGTYWQGRYYLPLLAGVPIVATRLRLDPPASRRLGLGVLGAALIVANLGFAAMMRRFAVGVSGTLLPWEWDTYGAPFPPVVLLALHLIGSWAIIDWARGVDADAGRRALRDREALRTAAENGSVAGA